MLYSKTYSKSFLIESLAEIVTYISEWLASFPSILLYFISSAFASLICSFVPSHLLPSPLKGVVPKCANLEPSCGRNRAWTSEKPSVQNIARRPCFLQVCIIYKYIGASGWIFSQETNGTCRISWSRRDEVRASHKGQGNHYLVQAKRRKAFLLCTLAPWALEGKYPNTFFPPLHKRVQIKSWHRRS